MNIFTSFKRSLWILGIVFGTVPVMSQNIALSSLAASPEPLAAGSTDMAIFGMEFNKDSNPNTITSITITLTDDPTDYFTNVRVFRSTNNSVFDAADFGNPVTATINVTGGPDQIVISNSPITNFTGSNQRIYFVVADILSSAPTGANKIQASLAAGGVVVGSPAVTGSATGENYDIAAMSTSFAELTGGVTTGALGSGVTDEALLGFSLTSNGNPDFTGITINTTSPAGGKLTNIRLFSSNNNSFGGGDASIATASSVTATTIVFSAIPGETLVPGAASFYFIVADIENTVDNTTASIELSFDEGDITLTGGGTITAGTVTGENYSFVDASPPVATIRNPTDNSTGISVLLKTVQITFSEDVTIPDYDVGDNDQCIRLRSIDGSTFLETIAPGGVTVVGNVVTITYTTNLAADIDYAIYIGDEVFEDAAGNPFAGYTDDFGWVFETEFVPNISSLSNGTRCIKDQLTINGSRFTGTGGTGNTKPRVRINGVIVHTDSVKSFSSTVIVLNVPPGATTGNVTVENMDNNLVSNGSALTVRPQINTALSVVPSTLSPAQGTSVNFNVSTTQDNNHDYDLILIGKPGGYSIALSTTVDSDPGNNGATDLNTGADVTPSTLTHIGTYTYRIDISRSGCTTRTIGAPPITVASLTATVSATDTSVCAGSSSILIGSTSGGTGFYQFAWKGPNNYLSNSSSPTITPTHPAGTGWYVLTLSDNSSNVAKDSVYITTFPTFAVSFEPVGTATSVQTEYNYQNQLFELNGSPDQHITAGASFSGPGVVSLPDSNKYYFNPQLAGVGLHTITYSFNNGNCTISTTKSFRVSSNFIQGLDPFYCNNTDKTSPLSVNALGLSHVANNYPGFTVSRLGFAVRQYSIFFGYSYYYYDAPYMTNTSGYQLDIDQIAADFNIISNIFFSTDFYVVVYASNGFVELDVSYNYFRIVPKGLPPNIVGLNKENICSSTSSPIVLSQSISGYSITDFSLASQPSYGAVSFDDALSGIGNKNFDPDDEDFFDEDVDEIPLKLTLDFKDNNGCSDTTSVKFNWVKKPNAPTALNDPSSRPEVEYCKVTLAQSFTIDASPNGSSSNPNWYAQDPVTQPDRATNPRLDSTNFKGFVAPGITGLVATAKDFYITQTFKGCEGNARIATITIKEAPNAAFTTPPICEDRNFTLAGPTDVGGVPFDLYEWDFDDGNGDTIPNNNLITYNYGPNTASLFKKIKLRVTNSLGCKNESFTNSSVGNNPIPKFTFGKVCETETTEFKGSTNIPVANYKWEFNDTSPIDSGATASFKNVNHQFPDAGDYTVKVTAYTAQQCFGSDSTIVSILEYLTFDNDLPYEMGQQDGGKGFWKLQDLKDSTTWEFNTTNKSIIKSAVPVWITNATGLYKADDLSVLNSPCFNISDMTNPVISLNFITNTDEKDGASLEYSVNSGKNWLPLGASVTGEAWFNSTFSSGGISKGWSGNLWNSPDNTWLEGKHGMEFIAESKRDTVRLRVIFSSAPDDDRYDGFAFTNLAIRPRNRIILVENFTNMTDPQYTANNTEFIDIDTADYVKLQYHMSFPDADAIHQQNPVDPNARAAFYGITNDSQTFPRVMVDGASKGNLTTNWFEGFTALRALKTSPFELDINYTTTENAFSITVTTEALREINDTFFPKPMVHLAIAETTVGSNEFVLRKLLPNPLGTELPMPIAEDDIIEMDPVNWPCTFDPSKVAIIAFIQDEVTKEVYQAKLMIPKTNLPTVITGVEPTFGEQIVIFPNPAQGEFNIELPKKINLALPVSLIDGFGREVYNSSFKIGEQLKTVNTSEFSGGVYILQIRSANGEVARKKVMVTNR